MFASRKCENKINSGPTNFTSKSSKVPSISFNSNFCSAIKSSDDTVATKFGGMMINFASNAFPISSLPAPASNIENSCSYASDTGSVVVSNSDFISW